MFFMGRPTCHHATPCVAVTKEILAEGFVEEAVDTWAVVGFGDGGYCDGIMQATTVLLEGVLCVAEDLGEWAETIHAQARHILVRGKAPSTQLSSARCCRRSISACAATSPDTVGADVLTDIDGVGNYI